MKSRWSSPGEAHAYEAGYIEGREDAHQWFIDTNIGDNVSRQGAIDAIMEEQSELRYPVYYAEKIRQLPSAQPEVAKDTNVPINDCISRQAAIDAADRADYTGLAVEDVKKVTDEVVKELKKLPSAQPEIDAAYEQGRIQGRVEMRTELLTRLKELWEDERED